MTLVLTFTSRDLILQVSDMRLTCPDGSVHDDYAAKAVVFCGRALFAYTGLACIGNTRTDGWIAGELSSATSVKLGIERLRESASKALERLAPSSRKLIIVGAGWVRERPDGPFVPLRSEISNVTSWDQPSLPAFISRTRVAGDKWQVAAHGRPLLEQERRNLVRSLRRCIDATTGIEPLARIMADVVRGVAARDDLVGSELLISSLPRWTAPADVRIRRGPVDWSQSVFLHVPSSDTAELTYGPATACAGMATFGVVLSGGMELPDPVPCLCPPKIV